MPGAVSNGESSLSLKAGLLRSRALQAHAETPRGRLLLARPVGARSTTLRGESRDLRGRHARTAAAPAREACLALGPSRNTKPFEPLTAGSSRVSGYGRHWPQIQRRYMSYFFLP